MLLRRATDLTGAVCIVAAAASLVACGQVELPPSTPPASAAVEIPLSDLSPADQCLIDAGFRPVRRAPAASGGQPSAIGEWETDLAPEQAMIAGERCRELVGPRVAKSEAEILEIYRRWLDERTCLVRLGYQPQPPPSAEKFVEDWRTGPWMPIDGIDTAAWTDAEYAEAKSKCTLEFYDRG
jgi:hypothetical protein